MIRRVRNRFRRIKWWFQRANGHLPPCDWWDYKYTLADNIQQGLEGLLHEGVTDWDKPCHRQEKKDLEYVLAWAKDFPYYAMAIIAKDEQDKHQCSKMLGGERLVVTIEEMDDFYKRTEKAFKLLGKHIWTLWD